MKKTNINVEFSLLGDDFNPEDISNKLLLEPTEYYQKGSKNNRNIERNESCWSIETGYVETLYISELFDVLLNKLEKKSDIICRMKEELKFSCKFFLVINIENNIKPAIYLDERIIKFANSVGAEFDFDLYIFNN